MRKKFLNPLKYFFILLFFIIIVGFFLVPLINVVLMAFKENDTLSLNTIITVLQKKKTWTVIKNTLYINVMSSLFASILGVVLAYIMAYSDIRHKKAIHDILLLPLIIPGYIITLAWMQFFAKNGSVALAIRNVLPSFTMPNIYSYWGIIFVFALTKYPIIYTLTLSTFRKISIDMELAASVAGCGRLKTFFKVTFPMSMSGFANGLLLVFISCLDNFGTVAFLGIPARITVLSTDIFQSVTSFSSNNFNIASVKSLILAIMGIVASIILGRLAQLFQTMQTEIEDLQPRIFLGKKKSFVEIIIWLFIIIVNLVPFTTLIQTSFLRGMGAGFTSDNLTLASYQYIFSNEKSLNAIKNSVILACSTALICLVIGTAIAYIRIRKAGRIIKLIDTIVSVPYSLPGIIIGLALILTWANPLPIINKTIYGTAFMLLISYVIRFTSVQIRSSTTAILQTDLSMEEAASVCGAGGFEKWIKVVIPLIFPAMFSGAGLVFINSFTELTTSSLLWSAGSETIGVVIHNYTSAGYLTYACALSVLVLITIFVLVGAYKLYTMLMGRIRRSEV